MRKFALATAAALVAVSAPALALWTVDDELGTGFVGKGDVQLALGLNNNQIQNTAVSFTLESYQETTWTCSRINKAGIEVETPRNQTLTRTGVLSSIARTRNQITGYNLTGFAPNSVITVIGGHPTGSCPSGNDGFTFDADSVVTEDQPGGGLLVNGVALDPAARY